MDKWQSSEKRMIKFSFSLDYETLFHGGVELTPEEYDALYKMIFVRPGLQQIIRDQMATD